MLPGQDRKNALAGIDVLRKICNHPDLLQRKQWESIKKYGDPVRSGKLTVAMKVCCLLSLCIVLISKQLFSICCQSVGDSPQELPSIQHVKPGSCASAQCRMKDTQEPLVTDMESLHKTYGLLCRCWRTGASRGTRPWCSPRRSRCWTSLREPSRSRSTGPALALVPSPFFCAPVRQNQCLWLGADHILGTYISVGLVLQPMNR